MLGAVTALYDSQCEVCQAGVSWIRLLDTDGLVRCVALQDGPMSAISADLDEAACLEHLHCVDEAGAIHVGWEGVVEICRRLPALSWVPTADRVALVHALADRGYRWIAANRYQLSKCRGGVCGVDHVDTTRSTAELMPFWTCYTLGMLASLPLIAASAARDAGRNVAGYARTRGRRVELLDGRLRLLFLGGWPTAVVPLAFGELFAAVWYRGLLVDPGSPRMRRSLGVHLDALGPGAVSAVCATHHHEEHIGNVDWAAERAGASLHMAAATAELARRAPAIPRSRAFIMGQPEPVTTPIEALSDRLTVGDAELDVYPVPGHSDDHVALYDPEARVLLVGDAFIGSHFSSPNPDVDSRMWIDSVERLLDLDVDVMVGGHGHVHTMRPDVADHPSVVIRRHPTDVLAEKLEFLRWLRDQVEAGSSEGLPLRAIEATCFPWGRRWSWERAFGDELARWSTAGEFSRSELVRSFRRASTRQLLPEARESRLFHEPSRRTAAVS